jgi:hypothetical protein
MMTKEFIENFLRTVEAKWRSHQLKEKDHYGFQFQHNTKWNPGLSSEQIDEYQHALNITFPDDFVFFLRHANGTDLPTLNNYGGSGNSLAYSKGVYSYPRDLEIVKENIQLIQENYSDIVDSLGLSIHHSPKFIPFFMHRYILSGKDLTQSPVYSILGIDAIFYEPSLREYLEREF